VLYYFIAKKGRGAFFTEAAERGRARSDLVEKKLLWGDADRRAFAAADAIQSFCVRGGSGSKVPVLSFTTAIALAAASGISGVGYLAVRYGKEAIRSSAITAWALLWRWVLFVAASYGRRADSAGNGAGVGQ